MATVSDVQFGIVFTQYSRLITTVYSITKATAKAKPNTTTDYSREEVKASPSLSLSFCWFATASKKAAEGLSFPHMPTHPTLFVPPPPSLHRCLRLRSRTSHHYHGLRSKTKAKALFKGCWCIFATVFLLLCSLASSPFNFWLTNMSASQLRFLVVVDPRVH